ncbi:MAG: hypothetical protein ACPGUC_02010 [Gammaproteobacteria bacterium]
MIDRETNMDDASKWFVEWCEKQPGYIGFHRRYLIVKDFHGEWLLVGATVCALTDGDAPLRPSQLTKYDYGDARLVEDWPTENDLTVWLCALSDGDLVMPCGATLKATSSINWSAQRLYQWHLPGPPAGKRFGARLSDASGFTEPDYLKHDKPYFPDTAEAARFWLAYPYELSRGDRADRGEVSFLLSETRGYIDDFDESSRRLSVTRLQPHEHGREWLVKGIWWGRDTMGHFSQAISRGDMVLDVPAEALRMQC